MRLLSSEGRGSRRRYLSRLRPAAEFLRNGNIPSLPLSLPKSRARDCSGNDKTDSVATLEVAETRGPREEEEREREEEASFYGALNSDEVARSITERIRIILEQINRPPGRIGEGILRGRGEGVRRGKTGRRHF